MNDQIKVIEANLVTVEEILNSLDLLDDTDLARHLSTIKIELDGVHLRHTQVDPGTETLLSQIHACNLNAKLESIIQNALGYYALAEQPEGTNEPPIGPRFAQQLIHSIQLRTINIMDIKDKLHVYLTSSSPEKT